MVDFVNTAEPINDEVTISDVLGEEKFETEEDECGNVDIELT